MNEQVMDLAEEQGAPVVTRKLVEQYLAQLPYREALTEEDRERFITIAELYQLNPYKREIHAKITRDGGQARMNLIVGYEVYIKKAEQTGLLDGWHAWIEGSGEDLKAVVEINRKDWDFPFLHEAYWLEAVQRNSAGTVLEFWERMPRFQLKKVAISQGFRMCFASEIGGIPYEGTELGLVDGDKVTTSHADTPAGQGRKAPQAPRNTPVKKESNGSVFEEIRVLFNANRDMLSSQHQEWIATQMTQEKTERQLEGLLKHLKESIALGGDQPKAGMVKPYRGDAKTIPYPTRGKKRPATGTSSTRVMAAKVPEEIW